MNGRENIRTMRAPEMVVTKIFNKSVWRLRRDQLIQSVETCTKSTVGSISYFVKGFYEISEGLKQTTTFIRMSKIMF